MTNDLHSRQAGESNLRWLQRMNAERGSNYFSRETLDWFGSEKGEVIVLPSGGFIYSELQTRAPEGFPPWRAQRFDSYGNQLAPSNASWSREEAIATLPEEGNDGR